MLSQRLDCAFICHPIPFLGCSRHGSKSYLHISFMYEYIFLIIDSDTLSVYSENRSILKKIFNKISWVRHFFIRCDPTLPMPFCIKDDVFYCKSEESFIPGILNKTISAFEFVLSNFTCKYIVRANLSSFWNIPKLLSQHGQNSENSKYVFAMINNYGFPYPSGAGFIISPEIAKRIVENKHLLNKNLIDDMAIGELINKLNIPYKEAKRFDLILNNQNALHTRESLQNIIGDNYHFRVKGEPNRTYDNKIFNILFDIMYK